MYVCSLFVLCLSAHICHTVTAVTCHTGEVTVAANQDAAVMAAQLHDKPVPCAAGQRCIQAVGWTQKGTETVVALVGACDEKNRCTDDNTCGKETHTENGVVATGTFCCCNTDKCDPDEQLFLTWFNKAAEEYKKAVEEASGSGQNEGGIKAIILVLIVQLGLAAVIV